VVAGNWIGIAPGGASAAANQVAGVLLEGGTTANQIGRATRGNIISGNTIGIKLDGATRNTVAGNIIGLRPDGTTPLPNSDGGIFVVNQANTNTIGGAGAGNVIAGNGIAGTLYGQGLYLADSDANSIQGNWFGTTAESYPAFGNLSHGVLLLGDANENLVGGAIIGEGNIIGFSGSSGLRIDIGAAQNQVVGNAIGVAIDGVTPIGNQQNGVLLDGDSNIIGPGNRIMFNQRSGVLARGTTSIVRENEISINERSGVCIIGSATQLLQNVLRFNGAGTEAPTPGCGRGSGVVISSTVQALLTNNLLESNAEYGIAVIGGRTNRFVTNSIRGNVLGGIALDAGANDAIDAPVLISATSGSASGRGCGTCEVEIFGDSANQGERFIGRTTAAADGTFQLTFSGVSEPFLTATNTDAVGNTSHFAAAAEVTDAPPPTPIPTPTTGDTPRRVYLPAVRHTP
jgi:hypothetical protein